jgi:hypothetical protein
VFFHTIALIRYALASHRPRHHHEKENLAGPAPVSRHRPREGLRVLTTTEAPLGSRGDATPLADDGLCPIDTEGIDIADSESLASGDGSPLQARDQLSTYGLLTTDGLLGSLDDDDDSIEEVSAGGDGAKCRVAGLPSGISPGNLETRDLGSLTSASDCARRPKRPVTRRRWPSRPEVSHPPSPS